ncbi:MAG: glycosyltransferase, partial [Anaerolineales bacterium]|nr:glycosyltransferase [Anaerolineales bacterium]
MRILFAADVPPDINTGAAGTELQTIEALRARGHQVDTIWAEDLTRRIRHGNLHYLLELPRTYRSAIATKWQSCAYDVVHINQAHGWLAARDHHKKKRPGVVVIRSHGLDDHMEKTLAPWRKKIGIPARRGWRRYGGGLVDVCLDRHMRLAAKEADGFIVSSSLDRAYLINHHHIQQKKIAAIAQAPPRSFLDMPAIEMGRVRLNRVLYVAGFAWFKGSDT